MKSKYVAIAAIAFGALIVFVDYAAIRFSTFAAISYMVADNADDGPDVDSCDILQPYSDNKIKHGDYKRVDLECSDVAFWRWKNKKHV